MTNKHSDDDQHQQNQPENHHLSIFESPSSSIKAPQSLLARTTSTTSLAHSEKKALAAGEKMDPLVLLQGVTSLAAEFLNSSSFGAGDDFFQHGGTSVQALELASKLSSQLGVQLTLDDLFADARPRKIVQKWMLKQGLDISALDVSDHQPRHLSGQSVAVSDAPPGLPEVKSRRFDNLNEDFKQQQIEDIQLIQYDMQLVDTLPWVEEPSKVAPQCILLTGATGFLGSHVLFDLLRHSEAHIVCLVRGQDDLSAEKRLADELNKRDFLWSGELKRRVSVIAGDIGKERLGWTDAVWADRANTVDAVINVAAAVDFVRGYHSLRDSNVLGVHTLVKFACTGKIKPLHQVSSLAVFDEYNIPVIGEDESPARLERLFSGYDKSKWCSEALLKRAREHGLCVTLMRPGGISGNTQTGVYNPLDLSSGLIAAFQSMRLIPEFRYMNLAPVDWISRVIAQIAIDPEAWGRNYHLIGKPRSLRQQVREMNLSGMASKVVDFPSWREQFLQRMQGDPIPNLEFLEIALKNKATVKLLEAVFSWPAATAVRVDALIAKHNLPERPENTGQSQVRTLERLERDGRATLPGRNDIPYLEFNETMKGQLYPLSHDSSSSESEPAEFSFILSVASFLQIIRERRIDVRGSVRCSLLHGKPLTITAGNLWVRPQDGVPLAAGFEQPLIKYILHLVDDDGHHWLLQGMKHARPGWEPLLQARTLDVECALQGQAASFQGTMVVPSETYIDEQIKGLRVNPNVPEQEQYVAKALWLAWFGGQMTLGLVNPLLRVGGGILDTLRRFKGKGE